MTASVRITVIAATLLLVSLVAIVSSTALADEWPTIHADPANTGYSAEQFDPVFFDFRWENLTAHLLHSSPVVYGVGLWFGSVDQWLYAIDWADGHAYWLYDTGLPVWSSAAVYEDWVYITTPLGLYKFEVFNPFVAFLYPLSTEVLEYTPPKFASNTVFTVGSDGYAYGVNATTGMITWKTWIGNTSGYADRGFGNESLNFNFSSYNRDYIRSSCPAYYKDKLYVGSWDSGLWALDATTGEVLWRFQANTAIIGGVSAYNNTIYFGTENGRMYAIDAYDGELRWTASVLDSVWSTPAVANDRVYIGSYGETFFCLNASTGQEIWTVDIGARISSSAAVTDKFVTFGGEDGVLYVLNATNGMEILRFQTEDKITSSPAIANGFIYFTSWDAKVYGIGREPYIINLTTTLPVTTPPSTDTTTPSPAVTTTLFAVFAASILSAIVLRSRRRRDG